MTQVHARLEPTVDTITPETDISRVRKRTLFVRDQQIEAYIGIYAHEKAQPQPVIVSVEVTVDYNEGHLDDDFANVLNYEDITTLVKQIANTGHINLVETMADRIAMGCFSDPMVVSAKVEVTKPEALSGVGGVGVTVEHTRLTD